MASRQKKVARKGKSVTPKGESVEREIKASGAASGNAKTSHRAVWDRPPPRAVKHTKLSSKKKAAAKARAKRAGRPYPNLVDNMRAARRSPAKPAGKSQ